MSRVSSYNREGKHSSPAACSPSLLDWDGRFEPTFKEVSDCLTHFYWFVDDLLGGRVSEPLQVQSPVHLLENAVEYKSLPFPIGEVEHLDPFVNRFLDS